MEKKSRKKTKRYTYDFWTLLPKFYWLTFKNFHGSVGPRYLSRDLLLGVGKRTLTTFRLFCAYLKQFLSFVHDSNILSSSCCRHQNFDYESSSCPANEAESRNLAVFYFFWPTLLIFTKKLINVCTFPWNKWFCLVSMPWTKNYYSAEQIFEKPHEICTLT